MQSPIGPIPAGLFAVTAIKVDKHRSVAAANQSRRKVAAAGRSLLHGSVLPALSLFQYKPSLGTVVDLRDLKVGGS